MSEDQPGGRLFRPDCSSGGIFWYPEPTNKTSNQALYKTSKRRPKDVQVQQDRRRRQQPLR